jgi:hypothetical protein
MPVYYEVLENGSDPPHVSQEHTLRVSGMSNFPTVQCDKVSANQLSLSGIPNGGHASFTLESWSFMATDQFINIKVDGTDSASQGVTVEVLKAFQVPEVADRINVGRISKTDLQRFKIGGGLTVKVEVSFDGRISWQPFPRLTPILVN